MPDHGPTRPSHERCDEPLREVIKRHRLTARKGLGQHFLLDQNLTRRIVRAAGEMAGITVLEIGPGPGGLTRALLEAGAKRVVAVERDRRCVAALENLIAAHPGRLEVIHADALEIDEATLIDGPAKIVANLPYSVATALLLKWIEEPERFQSLTLMFQKEVADRLVAPPGNKTYGRLSVMTQWRFTAQRLFDVAPRAFVPPPKVTSTVVGLEPRRRPLAVADRGALESVLAAAFGQRRKMLRTSLKRLEIDTGALLASAGITPTARAEELDVARFCALARAYEKAATAPRRAGGQRRRDQAAGAA